MSLWKKVESLGGAVSGGAALIVAIVAVVQVQQNDTKIEEYFNKVGPTFEQLLAREKYENDALALKPIFEMNKWEPMSTQELWASQEMQSLKLSEKEFILTIRGGLSAGFIREERQRNSRTGESSVLLAWDRMYRFSAN